MLTIHPLALTLILHPDWILLGWAEPPASVTTDLQTCERSTGRGTGHRYSLMQESSVLLIFVVACGN